MIIVRDACFRHSKDYICEKTGKESSLISGFFLLDRNAGVGYRWKVGFVFIWFFGRQICRLRFFLFVVF